MRRTHVWLASGVLAAAGVAAGVIFQSGASRRPQPPARRLVPHFRRLDRDVFRTALSKVPGGGEPLVREGAAQEDYDNRAYPSLSIAPAQQAAAAFAANIVGRLPGGKRNNWQEIGPSGVPASALVVSESTGGSVATTFSGRTTAIAISPTCRVHDCRIFIGAAGGGVWQADNPFAAHPNWRPSGSGIPSNAIGSIAFDPTDPSGRTLYVGTGEANGSSDSEAGVGLYRSTDLGRSWTLVAGSTASTAPCAVGNGTCPVAVARSIAAVAVDPADGQHIFIGTAVARHGSSSVNGGRFTPPGAARVGLYESTDGGSSFTLAFSQPADAVDPANPTGNDFFRGGASHVELNRASGETQVFVSLFDYGIYRRSHRRDGDMTFHQIFASQGAGSVGLSSIFRTEFSLAPNGAKLRIYVGDGGADEDGFRAQFYRVDNANVPAATLYDGSNLGWKVLSNPAVGTPGFASFNYCSGQCTYDMPVYSPPGAPDIVYIGGAMQYDEIGGRSNGRAVQRSQNAGESFTDMTIDAQGVSRHPDQHAMAAAPFNPNILFTGDDGGVWRTDGGFSDLSSECVPRNLSAASLANCRQWLSRIPTTISSLNEGLGTLQYQSLSVSAQDPLTDIIGGTQDNGTHAWSSKGRGNGKGNSKWFVTIFGDGGQSGIDVGNPDVRTHTFFGPQGDINFNGNDPLGWDWMADPIAASGEGASFYVPLIADPVLSGSWFVGLQHVWRTQDNHGGQAFMDQHCNEFFGDFTVTCGNWQPIGQDLTSSSFGSDKTPGSAGYIVATERAASDSGTLWAGLRRGRVFVSSNADAASPGAVTFFRIDNASTPTRFVSGIAIDPANPNHAFISFSGYNAYATATSTATGHVFEVTYNPSSHTATWTKRDYNLGDQPITDIAFDRHTGDLYVSTDFGVNMLHAGGTQWVPAAGSLPPVAVYGLTIDQNARMLYAATHGRGAWRLDLR